MWLMWFRGLGCVDPGGVLVSLSVGSLAFLSAVSVVWAARVLGCRWLVLGCWVGWRAGLGWFCFCPVPVWFVREFVSGQQGSWVVGGWCLAFGWVGGLVWAGAWFSLQKLQSWLQIPNGNWELVKIVSTSGKESVVSLPEGKVQKVKSESLISANPDILDGVDDLMQLSYLNEPVVLYNLQYRYKQDTIYTKAGPVLVASNPFKKVPLYGNDYIEAYKNKSIESPHVYAITDTAIREMTRGAFCV
ncbi:hypothetical protein Patl1_27820 [Pistacia atlantica]|uniref:Uncharacterized protein n=1 Tax=Pistacia atlantica TaxID=434234 RepID=A0ACC1BFU2_9ROSI|nr:hypothetical protein Patl1_27820 [Pistacia atlantica]